MRILRILTPTVSTPEGPTPVVPTPLGASPAVQTPAVTHPLQAGASPALRTPAAAASTPAVATAIRPSPPAVLGVSPDLEISRPQLTANSASGRAVRVKTKNELLEGFPTDSLNENSDNEKNNKF